MIDLSTGEWKEALRLVQAAFDAPGDDAARAAAFDFLRTARSKRLIGLAHLLQPGATLRSMQAALVPLERVDKRAKVTDSEMGIRTADAPAGRADRAAFTVVADNVRSAFNSGGIFRTADFFGADRLILCGYTPGPESAQVKKTALGADETTPWERAGDVRDAIDRLRAEGRRIYALETADGATDVSRLSPAWPCALLLGNERFGLDPDVVAMADEVVEIPSHGMKNSLNVVSAFAVAAAFFRRSR
ncbi:MAG: TrmH family RNA methyltransferase [Kiritimatiellae bacterium]|nr:TrmH family RNA methyltransferase [Kiritimatiellia bacterium]